jgi:hypothetical protein
VAARYGLALAHSFAGRLRECLAVAEQGLGLAQWDLALGGDRIGFNPSFLFFKGMVLSLTGHPREGGAAPKTAITASPTNFSTKPS